LFVKAKKLIALTGRGTNYIAVNIGIVPARGRVKGADSRIDFLVLSNRKSLWESAAKTYTGR
jgi:hypothetical protein